ALFEAAPQRDVPGRRAGRGPLRLRQPVRGPAARAARLSDGAAGARRGEGARRLRQGAGDEPPDELAAGCEIGVAPGPRPLLPSPTEHLSERGGRVSAYARVGRPQPLAMTASTPGPKDRAPARVGQVLRGKWKLDSLLAVGGMASVY